METMVRKYSYAPPLFRGAELLKIDDVRRTDPQGSSQAPSPDTQKPPDCKNETDVRAWKMDCWDYQAGKCFLKKEIQRRREQVKHELMLQVRIYAPYSSYLQNIY